MTEHLSYEGTTEVTLLEQHRRIDAMTHLEMAAFWRFAPSSDPIVQGSDLWELFEKKFKEFGGMTPEMSKRIGFR